MDVVHKDDILSPKRRDSIDKDAQEMVIDSLRAQINDLVSQVTGLNSKLVNSYDRVSDLEDDLHTTSSNLRASSLQISNLEIERSQHLAALNTGLLVERSHVTTELTRLMEKATEEAAQRGQAESARAAIEKELEDLSAALFGQANTMVAEARFARHNSERKVDEAERALKSAEEAVQLMQTQMQILQTEKEEAEMGTQKMEALVGKRKWVDKRDNDTTTIERRWLNIHLPYREYLTFLAHLRHLHLSSPNPPAMSTLLPLPFPARLLTEDSEPTVRLDLAPSLNWLSRRSVLTAIHSGQLTVEPISAASLFTESSPYVPATVAGLSGTNEDITCALCGCSVFSTLEPNLSAQPRLSQPSFQTNTWSPGAFFRKSSLPLGLNGTAQPSPPGTGVTSKRGSFINSQTQIYIFHLPSSPSSVMSSLGTIPPLPKSTQASTTTTSSSPMNNSGTGTTMTTATQPTTVYPLCMSGWCLTRLRTTCTLWSFIRTGIVEKIWEEEVLPPVAPPRRYATAPGSTLSSLMERTKSVGNRANGVEGIPPVPPRRKGLWGIASALGERAVSWGGEGGDKRASPARSSSPPPPPAFGKPTGTSLNKFESTFATPNALSKPTLPPPLPKRSQNRSQRNADTLATSPSNGTASGARPNTAPPDSPQRSPVKATHPSQGHVSAAAALLQRSQTPSNVPLPDSRPGTPGGNGGMLSRTASPAPLSGAPPPPIPRRAAARSRGLANERGIGEQPPLVVDKAENAEGGSEVKVQETRTDGAEKSVAIPPEVSKPEHEKDESGGEDIETDEDSIDEDKSAPTETFIDATLSKTRDSEDSADERDEKGGGGGGGEEISDDGSILVSISTNDEHAENDMVGIASTESGEHVYGIFEESSSSLSPDATVGDKTLVGGDEKKEKKQRGDLEEKDLANYVGDATWEERTWKELVRLRQDMFWARVGGFVV